MVIRIITQIPLLVNMTLGFRKEEERKMTQVKDRMNALGIKQVDMIFELQKRGIVVQPPELSQILRGVCTYPKAKRILRKCNQILDEHDSQ